jgi:hypothetical protein
MKTECCFKPLVGLFTDEDTRHQSSEHHYSLYCRENLQSHKSLVTCSMGSQRLRLEPLAHIHKDSLNTVF